MNHWETNTTTRGKRAEDLARAFLESKGMLFIERGFRWKGGEIDLIFHENRDVIFVEVRSSGKISKHLRFSITQKKLERIYRTAALYLSKRGKHGCGSRFDVVWVECDDFGVWRFEHWKNVSC